MTNDRGGLVEGHSRVSPLFKGGGGTRFLNFSKRKKILGWGKKKGGNFQKKRGGTQLFKLDLGIEKNKNWDF